MIKSTLFMLLTVALFSCENNPQIIEIRKFTWTLTHVNGNPVEEGYGLEFGQEGLASALTTCNYITAEYSFGTNDITFSDAVRSSMACDGADYDFEEEYASFLNEQVSYTLDGEILTLSKEGDTYIFKKKIVD